MDFLYRIVNQLITRGGTILYDMSEHVLFSLGFGNMAAGTGDRLVGAHKAARFTPRFPVPTVQFWYSTSSGSKS